MTAAAARTPVRVPHPWALGIGLVLLVPQIVLAFLVVTQPIVVGLSGFAMCLGFVRLGLLGSTVVRERRPGTNRGLLLAAGAGAVVVGGLLYSAVATAVLAARDTAFTGAVAPPEVVLLNLVVVAVLGLWIVGLAVALAAIAGVLLRRP